MNIKHFKKQEGMTLIEIIGALAIVGAVVAGAMALYNTGDSSQKSTSLITNLSSLRAVVKSAQMGQGTYGTGSYNTMLHMAKKIPTDIRVDTSTNPYTLTHAGNGRIDIAGSGSSFTITVTNLGEDVCSSVVSAGGGSGWAGISVNGTALTMPTRFETATTACGASSSNVVTLTAM
jgi:type II secretory pathway pseudopilin PulG